MTSAYISAAFFAVPFLFFFATFLVGLFGKDFEYTSLGFVGTFFSGFGVAVSVASIIGMP